MQDTETRELAEQLERQNQSIGRYQVKLKVLRWMQKHRDELGESLKESLLKEIA